MMDMLVMQPRPMKSAESGAAYSSRSTTYTITRSVEVVDGPVVTRRREYTGSSAMIPSPQAAYTTHSEGSLRPPVLAPTVPTHSVASSSSRQTPDCAYFPTGTKVEYFSETMNGWVLSYVKGVNADGTYCLNTKKSAPMSRVRSLIACVSSCAISMPSAWQFVVSLQFRNSTDLAMYRNEILSILGLRGSDYSIVRMGGFTGGQNEGIYFVQSSVQGKLMCMKLVRSGRIYETVPSELDHCLGNLSRFPELCSDAHVTFPSRVIQLEQNRVAKFDVFVMPLARGERMAEAIGDSANSLCISSNKRKIESIFEAVGNQLKSFHLRYTNTQHCDLQTSNIFLELRSGGWFVTFIDLGGMGSQVLTSDVEYFRESIRLLSRTYGSEFEHLAAAAFEKGYGQWFSKGNN